jgi:hypothetical protein
MPSRLLMACALASGARTPEVSVSVASPLPTRADVEGARGGKGREEPPRLREERRREVLESR